MAKGTLFGCARHNSFTTFKDLWLFFHIVHGKFHIGSLLVDDVRPWIEFHHNKEMIALDREPF